MERRIRAVVGEREYVVLRIWAFVDERESERLRMEVIESLKN